MEHRLLDLSMERVKDFGDELLPPVARSQYPSEWSCCSSKCSKPSTSHHRRGPGIRRQEHKQGPWQRHSLFLSFIILLTCFCSSSIASSVHDSLPSIEQSGKTVAEPKARLAELAEPGTITVDQLPPPLAATWRLGTTEKVHELKARKAADTTSSVASPSSTVASSTKSSLVTSAATESAIPLPSPFDVIGNSFQSQTCPAFINSILNNLSFKACLPFSLLLENSLSFFQATKSLVQITQVLNATCAANVTSCTPLLNGFANTLILPANCGADFANANPTVVELHTDLLAYKPLYQASCLKNPRTNSFCFADAITNSSSIGDSYVYHIALNETLPSGNVPSCDICLQNTMAVFAAAAANRSQPVSTNYVSAAQQINSLCGPGFVNATLPAPVANGVDRSGSPALGGLVALFAVVVAMIL